MMGREVAAAAVAVAAGPAVSEPEEGHLGLVDYIEDGSECSEYMHGVHPPEAD